MRLLSLVHNYRGLCDATGYFGKCFNLRNEFIHTRNIESSTRRLHFPKLLRVHVSYHFLTEKAITGNVGWSTPDGPQGNASLHFLVIDNGNEQGNHICDSARTISFKCM